MHNCLCRVDYFNIDISQLSFIEKIPRRVNDRKIGNAIDGEKDMYSNIIKQNTKP